MPSSRLIFDAAGEGATEALGAALAKVLPPGTTVALLGTLGAGKTRLVQAVAVACGVDPREVVSPTFVLVHEYHGRRPICHIDAYRLRDEDEFAQLGPDEFFESGWRARCPASGSRFASRSPARKPGGSRSRRLAGGTSRCSTPCGKCSRESRGSCRPRR